MPWQFSLEMNKSEWDCSLSRFIVIHEIDLRLNLRMCKKRQQDKIPRAQRKMNGNDSQVK